MYAQECIFIAVEAQETHSQPNPTAQARHGEWRGMLWAALQCKGTEWRRQEGSFTTEGAMRQQPPVVCATCENGQTGGNCPWAAETSSHVWLPCQLDCRWWNSGRARRSCRNAFHEICRSRKDFQKQLGIELRYSFHFY